MPRSKLPVEKPAVIGRRRRNWRRMFILTIIILLDVGLMSRPSHLWLVYETSAFRTHKWNILRNQTHIRVSMVFYICTVAKNRLSVGGNIDCIFLILCHKNNQMHLNVNTTEWELLLLILYRIDTHVFLFPLHGAVRTSCRWSHSSFSHPTKSVRVWTHISFLVFF